MTFWDHFRRLLLRRPVPALAALYWHLTRRRVRARNRLRVASADLAFAYDLWIAANEKHADLGRAISGWKKRPRFAVLPHAAGQYTDDEWTRSIASLERQIYPNWSVIGNPADSLWSRWNKVDADYFVPLRVGDILSPAALFRFAEALQASDAAVLYGDQDRLDARGRRRQPWFKPKWNEEMFLAQDYLSDAIAIKTNLVPSASARSGSDFSAFLLAATAAAGERIVHVPHIIAHVANEAAENDSAKRVEAVERHLSELGASCVPGSFGTVNVRWPLPAELPFVSIIVPTKDKLDLLRPCVEGVLNRTDYPNLELLVVDNGSSEQRTLDYLAGIGKNPKARVLEYPGTYNFSAINNFAVARARGAYICLLNNDTEVIGPGWLAEMMRYALRPNVGAVGAKLLYNDQSIQHAGVVIGIGEAAGHAHRFLPASEPGYFHQPHIAQFISAVTAACLVVEKTKFEAVGGLDEANLAVAFNDVDLCLKLQAAGWRNVYVPHAVLLHHESKSRGSDLSPENVERYRRELKVLQDRWGTKSYDDPLHNPNLNRYTETFVIAL